MIMQCSYDALDPIQSSLDPVDPVGIMNADEPCGDVKPTIDQLPAIKQRTLYLQIAVIFKDEVEQEKRTMHQEQTLRKRLRSQGLQPSQEPVGHGTSPKTRVLDRLANKSEARKRLTQYVQLGNNLHFLSSRLGPAILLSFPADTTLACDFQLPLPWAGKRNGLQILAKRLDPKSYVGPRASHTTSEDVHRPTLATIKDLSQNLDPSSSQCGFGPGGGFVPTKRRHFPIERVIATSSHHTHTHEHRTIQNVEFRMEDLKRQTSQPRRQHHQRHQLCHELQVSWKSPTQWEGRPFKQPD